MVLTGGGGHWRSFEAKILEGSNRGVDLRAPLLRRLKTAVWADTREEENCRRMQVLTLRSREKLYKCRMEVQAKGVCLWLHFAHSQPQPMLDVSNRGGGEARTAQVSPYYGVCF